MRLWDRLFGKKYLSWEEYQEQMQTLEDQIWQHRTVKRPILPVRREKLR